MKGFVSSGVLRVTPMQPKPLPPGMLPGLEVRGRDPDRRMRPLDRTRHDMARRQVEVLALVAGEQLVLEHRQDGVHRLAPDLAPDGRIEPEPLDDVGRGAAAGAELRPALRLSTSSVATFSAIMKGLWTRHQNDAEAEPHASSFAGSAPRGTCPGMSSGRSR